MQKLMVDKEVIEDIAIELGISPSFIEKDFYACKILNELSGFNYENTKFIFTGGTCLSKGYGLIKRFSEDIDFRVLTPTDFNRTRRKELRTAIIDKLKQINELEVLEETLLKRNESRFFSFYIKYPKIFDPNSSLRSELKMEFTFEQVLLPVNKCSIQSILGKYINDSHMAELDCISPIEVAANKFSALLWRIDIKNIREETTENDGTIMRHLHDLAALENFIMNDDFIKTVYLSFEADKGRGGSNKDVSLPELAKSTLNKLKTEKIYSKEYREFVDALSYAREDEIIGFTKALGSFERIVYFVCNNSK
jgi:predicted nucleotidyltransferase component of viral defense system